MATRRQAKRAIEIHQEELTQYPNVVGLGVVPGKEAKGSGDLVVGVYVTKIVPWEELKPEERIPITVEIPARQGTHKVKTRVITVGEIELDDDQFYIESS